MFIMLWRELERPDPTLHLFLTEQAEGHMLHFSRHVLPTPDILSTGYVFVRISRCQVTSAFSQHTSKSCCACRANLTLPGSAPARGVHTPSASDVAGGPVRVPSCGFPQTQPIGCDPNILD